MLEPVEYYYPLLVLSIKHRSDPQLVPLILTSLDLFLPQDLLLLNLVCGAHSQQNREKCVLLMLQMDTQKLNNCPLSLDLSYRL